uniref:Thrombospondin, type I, domain containing 1 n=1 Tax=Nothobranchius rachovii TaxID=451742 RepID=A0A1A8RF73_9TELE
MPQAVSLLPFLLLVGHGFAELSIWPSFHVALSKGSVFVDFSTKSNSSNATLSLVDMETNTTVLSRALPSHRLVGRVEFDCSCFLYAGTFRFLLRQTSSISPSNGSENTEHYIWWWSSELQVQWPTFHIAVEKAGNHSASFQVGISTNEHFQACSSGVDSALILEVSYMEYNQIGRNTNDKIRARTRTPIKALRSQSVELSCVFPFTERDFITVALQSPHTGREVKSSAPFYLSRIFSYKLLVENASAYKRGCEGTLAVKMITPPCAHVSGKVLLYGDAGSGRSAAASAAKMGFGPEEPSSPVLTFNFLAQGENQTEFNCSSFSPGKHKYCFRFVSNFSRSPSPACLVVYRSAESWGPWERWSVCSVSCGEGVRERARKCLLPSGERGMQCTGMVKEQSQCSLEGCNVLPSPSPSLPPMPDGVSLLGGNVIVVVGISLFLAVIMATVAVTVWRKLCKAPQCSSVHRGSMHSPGGRKLSDEASICGHSLQRPSLTDGHGPSGDFCTRKDRPPLAAQAFSPQTEVMPLSQDPQRLSPTGQKVLPPIFGYRLAQQQLKEMKRKGLKEATQLYHVSSSPVHDTVLETPTSPTTLPTPTPTGLAPSALLLGLQDNVSHNHLCIATPLSELSPQTSKVASDRLSPRAELLLGPRVSTSGRSSNWRQRTADWVEMVEWSGLAGPRGGNVPSGMSHHKNPNFRRTSSFNDTKPQLAPSSESRQFRERSMTQVGSRTLPEGSCRTKGGWERRPHRSYPIPEHRVSEWSRNDQRKLWMEAMVPPLKNQLKHAGTNTDSLPAPENHVKADFRATGDRKAAAGPVDGVSGIGGPSSGLPGSHDLNQLNVDRAEQNWNRRGPSPIQRNMLARKLKEAQSYSGTRGRKRSSSFNVSSSERTKDWCHSLPTSRNHSSSGASPYRLSEAEQRMLDLDLSPGFLQEEE